MGYIYRIKSKKGLFMKFTSLENLGRIVCYHRKQSGLSRLALAELAGIGKTAVFDIEKGRKDVRLQTLLPILQVLNISMEFSSPLMTQCLEEIQRND
jgi:transcriptional regulator with XRE-family HTH domain